MPEKQKVLVIVGPTAVGKTALSIEAAKKLDGEIISGDSMQVYKKIDIGTAKVTEEERQGIPHHLIDVCSVEESFTASDFQKVGRKLIDDIYARGKKPIVVGGTGLYIESLLYEMPLGRQSSSDAVIRQQLQLEAEEQGKQHMWEKLKKIDSAAAETIHPNNVRRVIRALEVYETTGETFSSQQEEKKEARYDHLIVGLMTDRSLLYERINQRVDEMIERDLVEEARMLWETVSPDVQSAKGIGYKELFAYFEEESTLEESIQKIKQHSRNYAKRQLTWLRNRMTNIHWYDLIQHPEQKNKVIDQMMVFMNEHKK